MILGHKQTGFTLVEVLITLVLLSMVAAIVFGSLGQVVNIRARLRPYLDKSEQTALVAGWFRQTVQAFITDYDTGKTRFAASAKAFSGLTASPLLGPAGTPTAFGWALSYDAALDLTTLEYNEKPHNTVEIARWGGKDAVFSYYGQDQEWHHVWPPDDLDRSTTAMQLPQLVRLGGLPTEVFPTIVAAPRAAPVPRPPPPDLFGAALSQN